MALRPLVWIPELVLHTSTKKVERFDAELQTLIDDMIETMYHEKGVGLAANQIGIPLALTVLDASETRDQPMVLANPEILERKDEELMSEGCLSVPGFYDEVPRAKWIRYKAQDRHGKSFEAVAEGFLAHVIQHETDHLNGKVYIDYLSMFKRTRIVDKFKKLQKLKMRRGQK